MKAAFRWGVMGPGKIARKFAAGVAVLDDARIEAVGSRSPERARAFAEETGAARNYGSYEELAADPDLDGIYVATPHTGHRHCTELALLGGTPVLCEKPLAPNTADAEAVISLARKRGLFLMEGMWTRFMPAMERVRSWLADGRIGRVLRLTADFSFRGPWDPESRLLSPALAGGGLLDVGLYTIWLADDIFGREPDRMSTDVHIGTTGVDEQAAVVFHYDDGALAVLTCGVRCQGSLSVEIVGTTGRILVPAPFWRSEAALLEDLEYRTVERFEHPHAATAFEYEAAAAAQCIRSGATECERVPWSASLRMIRRLDAIRARWGLRYPFE